MKNNHSFPKVIKIGSRLIGEGQPALFIADIGANFDGQLEKAKKLALAAKEAGADIVKFQTFTSAKIVSGPSFSKMKLKGVHGTWSKPIDVVFKEFIAVCSPIPLALSVITIFCSQICMSTRTNF